MKKKELKLKKMPKWELKKYKELLLKEREKISSELSHITEDALKKTQRDASGDLSGYSYHMADMASDDYEREFSLGRATEELDACRAAGVAVRICPGVTAASGAAASLGASLTLRGLARKLTFVTAHVRAGETLSLDWASLADPDATLAVYMGKSSAGAVSRGLIEAGLPADTPVALVEAASLPEERQFHTRLDLLPLVARTALGDGPALLLIGQAMARRDGVTATSSAAFMVNS